MTAIEHAAPPAPARPHAAAPEPGVAHAGRLRLLRVLCVLTVLLGTNYVVWRWGFSLNWRAWWIAVPLVLAETYSLLDVTLFAMTMWRSRRRPAPPAPAPDLSVDVFITTYNEPLDLVLRTAAAAHAIRYPHRTWVLDDGRRAPLREAAEALGIGYLARDAAWDGHPLHAKAGNLNNALMATDGEFVLILDADQVPSASILDRTLGYFADPEVALVQTPQTFSNVRRDDPLGSEAPLFYGPIQQGKDGWNAAFFCGSNAVLRREALMHLGLAQYVENVDHTVRRALGGAEPVLRRAVRSDAARNPVMAAALSELTSAVRLAKADLAAGVPLARVTYALQQRVDGMSRDMAALEWHRFLLESGDLHGSALEDAEESGGLLSLLAVREASPLLAVEPVAALLRDLDIDVSGEAQPLMPMATISVTEDMATSMRLHRMGWRSAYHHEVLAVGLAPEDLPTMLKQRLRWAQGTMQVLLRENPLLQRGMRWGQRLMYFATAWSYLSGYATVAYLAAPAVFLCLGILPVDTTAELFLLHFLPFMAVNQLMFAVASRGIATWRGQQYSLALFPVWIRATTTAFASVLLRRPLAFAVTPKTRQAVSPWSAIRVQLVAGAVLLVAAGIGATRLLLGIGEPIGTLVNLVWVGIDLASLGVLVRAARYPGFRPDVRRT